MNVRKKLKWQIDDSWDKVRQLVRLCLCVSPDPQCCTRCTDTFDSHLDYLTHTCRPAALYQCSMCGHLYFNDDDFQSHECTCLPAFRKETSGQLVKRKENGQLRQSVKRKEDEQHGQSVKRKEDGQHSQSVKRKEDGHFGQFVRRRESGTGQRRHVAQQSEISDSDQQIVTIPTLSNSEEKRKQLKRRLAVSDQDSGELLCPPEKELRTTSSSLTPSSQQMVSLLRPQIGAKMQEGKRGVLIVDVFTPKNDPTKGRKCTIIQHTVESLKQSDLGVSQKQQVSVETQDQNPPVVPVTQPTLVLELVAVKPGSGNPPNQHPSVTCINEHVTQHPSVISTNRHVPDDPKTQPSSVTSITQHDPAIHTIQHVPVYSQSHHIPVISKNQESSDHSTLCHASFDPQRQQDRISSINQLSPDVSQSQHASFNSISADGLGESLNQYCEATESESEIKYSVTLREVEENHATQQMTSSYHHTSLSQNEDVCTHDKGAEFLFIKSEQESSPENTLYIDYAEVEGVVMDTVDQQITMEDSTAVPGRHMEDSTAVPGQHMEDSTEKSEDSVNSTMEPGQYPEDANDSTVKSEDVDDSVIERDMENGATEPGVEISTVEPEDVDDSMTEPYVDDSATESGVDDEMEGDVDDEMEGDVDDEIEPDVDDSVTESGVDDEMEGDVNDSATEPGVDNEIKPDVDDSATEPDVNVSAREPDVDGSAREPNVEENLTEPNAEITEQVERDVAEMATHEDSLVSRCSEKVDEKEKTGDQLAGSRLGVEGSSHGRLKRQIPSILPKLETWESTRAREDITQENIYLVRGHRLRNRKKKPPTEAKQPCTDGHQNIDVDMVQQNEDDMTVVQANADSHQGEEELTDGHQNNEVDMVQQNEDDVQIVYPSENSNQRDEDLNIILVRPFGDWHQIDDAVVLQQSANDVGAVYSNEDENLVDVLSPSDYEEADNDDDDKDEDYIPSSDSDEEDEDGYSSSMSDILEPQDNSKWTLTIEKVLDEIANTCDPEERNDLMEPNSNDSEIETQVIEENRTIVENTYSAENASLENTLNEKPQERKLSHTDCVYDEDYPKVYVKKFQTGNEKSKHGRVYDRVYACLYCHQLLTNIQTHMMNKHANEKDVMEITRLKNRKRSALDKNEEMGLDRELKRKLSILRNKGNNLHNRKVLKWKEGELLVPRRSGKDRNLHIEEYGPCPNCEEWIILNTSIANHQVACPASTSKSEFHKGSSMLTVSVMTGKITLKGSKTLKKEVIPCMKRDNIAEIALKDDLIIGLGDIWVMKNVDNKRKRKYYSSFHMRLAARLLQELRKKKDDTHLSFQAALKPRNFDLFVESSLACAYSDSSEFGNDELHHPSTPVKLGFDISRLAGLKLAHSIKMSDEVGRQEAADFIQLLKMEWSTRVNGISRATLAGRNFNKKKPLPHPEDIAKLATYLVTELQKLESKLDPALADNMKFRKVAMLVQSRLLLYNRRQPGELEALSLEYYRRRSTSISDSDMSLRQQLSSLEKKMLKTQELVETRGKNGTRVPVIIPKEVIPAMEYLVNPVTRLNSGIKEENPFLFANSALDVIRAASSLEDTRSQCDVKFPERVHATNLRKHCATIAQVIGLKDHEMKWLCRHLGHTEKVHEQHYRSTSGLIERLDIAKLMLIQEGNLHGKFHGKSLHDIKFEDILSEESESAVSAAAPVDDALIRTEHVDDMSVVGDDDNIVEDFVNDDGVDILGTRKRAKMSTRKKWSKEEEEELRKYFCSYFNRTTKRTCPTRRECLEAIAKSKECGGCLHKRGWETIKKKMNNWIKKIPSLQKDEGLNYTLDDFRSHFRISRPTFEWTCKKIAPYLRHLPDSIYLCIPLEKQLLVTLWYLVTQDSTTAIMSRFNIGSTVFTESYAKMLNVLVNHLKKEIILHPEEHERQVIMDSFMQKQCFPNVLGVIGVSHVRIRNRTSDIPDIYVNSSGCYSLILQAICREDLRFIDCAVGCPGSYSNADVLKKSSIWQNGQTLCGNGHFLGNEAYPLTTWLLTPYHDSGGLTPQQQGYNKRLSGTQETIKRAFGCLKGRFNRLCFKNNIGLPKTPGDILACCILHNICVMNDEDVEEFYEDDSGDVEVPPCDLADIHSDGQIKRDNIARSLPH